MRAALTDTRPVPVEIDEIHREMARVRRKLLAVERRILELPDDARERIESLWSECRDLREAHGWMAEYVGLLEDLRDGLIELPPRLRAA